MWHGVCKGLVADTPHAIFEKETAMSEAAELTVRDVLQQIDRRVTGVEEGLRAQGGELRGEIAKLRAELQAEIAKLRTELQAEIAKLRTELHAEIAELRREMTSGFRWIVGLSLVQWMSLMGVMLTILMRQ